jgi:tRNA threonylcarbamoyladenosine biosynthesis protein TsaB
MQPTVSIAIETSSREGGVALGRGDEMIAAVRFDASQRHAVRLVARLEEMLAAHGLTARGVRELYISIGPGSFTGLRVGITVARTLAQVVVDLRCVAVPTLNVVAQNAADLDFENLAVVLDAKEQIVYAGAFRRGQAGSAGPVAPADATSRIVPIGPPELVPLADFLAALPRPAVVIGEATQYLPIAAPGITLGPPESIYPRPEALWQLGRAMAAAGQFTDYHLLQPLYLRKPEAVRLWEKRQS